MSKLVDPSFLKTFEDQGRMDLNSYFMLHAYTASLRGTCPTRKVGAVIVSSDQYLQTTGYNGAPHGLEHCTVAGCDPDLHGRCTRAVHAEMNAILQAARRGISLLGSTLYCTTRPCLNCAKTIAQVGILEVIFNEDDMQSAQRFQVLNLFYDTQVKWTHLGAMSS